MMDEKKKIIGRDRKLREKVAELIKKEGAVTAFKRLGINEEIITQVQGEQGALDRHLRDAAGVGGVKEIKYLLDKGANVNPKGEKDTALMRACGFAFNKKVVEFLISKGADVKAQNDYGKTALMKASEYGLAEIAYLLINAVIQTGGDVNAYVNAKNKRGDTALSYAKEEYYGSTISLLIRHGAKEAQELSLEEQKKLNDELIAAASINNLQKVKELIDKGK